MTSWFDRVATVVAERGRCVLALMLLATAVLGAGVATVEQSSGAAGVSGDSDLARAQRTVQEDFSARGANTTTTVVAVSDSDGNVLSKASLLRSLRYHRALRANRTLNATLVEDRPTVGVATLVARAAVARAGDRSRQDGNRRPARDPDGARSSGRAAPGTDGRFTLREGIERLESMNESAVAALVGRVLDPPRPTPASRLATRLLPRDYDPGSRSASARLIVVTQETEGNVLATVAISQKVTEGQLATRAIAKQRSGPETHRVVGRGLLDHQQSAAIGDSLAVLGPLALAFVVVALSLAYRSLLDVVLGLVGVVVVLVWTFGAMGWLGFAFGQTMVAVPILLVGLSVDYALHVVMRYREERGDGDDVRAATKRALAGVLPALALVTATTAVGFLANLTSPLGSIREFGVVTAVGIGSTLAVFGLFVPALRTELAAALGRRGWGTDRIPSVPGSSGRLGRLLGGGASLARRAPLAVLVVAALLAAAGAYGATGVEVSASRELFIADDPPDWTDRLPAAVEPGDYYLKENRRRVYSTFQSPDRQGYVLVEGNVTDPDALDRVATVGDRWTDSGVVFRDAGGDPAVTTPLTAMRVAAERNRSFRATLAAADRDGDGVPDRNLRDVYDALYAAAPDLATRTVHRTDDGEYDALRLRMAVAGDADRDAVVAALVEGADRFDRDGLRATAAGIPVVDARTTDRVSTTTVESLVVTLVVVLALLVVVFRIREGSGSLGALTLVPVALTVCWLLGTMALLELPISPVTSLVGGISVGIGVDYAIHVSERFARERREGADLADAIDRTVTGTGGAMASSAVTTAGGFGVLSLALLPALRQFGFVLAVGVVYAFLASVYVQPSLLVLHERYGARPDADGRPAVVTGDD